MIPCISVQGDFKIVDKTQFCVDILLKSVDIIRFCVDTQLKSVDMIKNNP